MTTPLKATFAFPFAVNAAGRIAVSDRDETIRAKIMQVLFTAPGERVHLPEFGCGLFNLVFEPNDAILAATMEFTIGQALSRWLGDEIAIDAVDVEAVDETVTVQVAYTNKQDLSQRGVRIHFR
jgi:phage baseplate assembly protein W